MHCCCQSKESKGSNKLNMHLHCSPIRKLLAIALTAIVFFQRTHETNKAKEMKIKLLETRQLSQCIARHLQIQKLTQRKKSSIFYEENSHKSQDN